MKKHRILQLIMIMIVCLSLAACAGRGKTGETAKETATDEESETAVNEESETTNVQEEEESGESGQPKELSAGDTAPDVTFDLSDGTVFSVSKHSGQVILLNFWATWCPPCVGEMPAFEKLRTEYEGEVCIIPVNVMEDRETVDTFLSDEGYQFPVGYDVEGKVFEKYPSQGIPYTVIIGKDGVITQTFVGARSADEQYEVYKEAIDAANKE